MNLLCFQLLAHGFLCFVEQTDVAARGIDVPLIDHVIHYHFPPSPKLFIHRSGRCARAGRIGFCWGLVEPDELAYMMDLHLFLGRRPSTGEPQPDPGDSEGAPVPVTYSLDDMTPELVHFGSVPESVLMDEVENVQRIMNAELSGSLDAESLRSLTKVCNNAMKQYRRTRMEASREGIRRAKAILEGDRLDSGQRIGTGSIPPHPLFRAMERDRQTNTQGVGGVENAMQREDFLRAMSNFRPKETVFEAFATGGGKEVGVMSQVDKGRTVASSHKKTDTSAALTAMKGMRRQMRMARDKGTSLVVAGSALCDASSNDGANVGDALHFDSLQPDLREQVASKSISSLENGNGGSLKCRISRAQRRRLKKSEDHQSAVGIGVTTTGATMPTKRKRGSDFRDTSFFIDNDTPSTSEEAQRSRQIEAAMQPSAASASRGSMGKALRMEEAMLEIVGDERDDLVRKQRMMRWDKSKRKYVQTTVGAELDGESKTKKTRLENGAIVKSDKLKLGELYEKWQKKTNRSIGRSGVFDDAEGGSSGDIKQDTGGKNRRKESVGKGRNELKSATAIKKDREKKQNLKIKNMKRTDRRVMEQKNKEQRSASRNHTFNSSSAARSAGRRR